MTNKIVLLAQAVVADTSNYPEVIVTQAMHILESSVKHREKIRRLWNWRHVFRLYNRTKREAKGMAYVRRCAIAGGAVRKVCAAEGIDSNEFHIAKNSLRWAHDNWMTLTMFKSSIDAFRCEDVASMLRYLSCVNAKRYDDTLEGVSFLRWIDKVWLAEILTWRLLNAEYANPPTLGQRK